MDNDEFPPLPSPDEMPTVTNQAELERVWGMFMGRLGFAAPQLWLLFLDEDGRVTPQVTKVEDLPDQPDEQLLTNLIGICREVLATTNPGGSVAFLYARPGGRDRTDADRAWAGGLTAGARGAGLATWPVHLANDRTLTVLAPDDLDWQETA